MKKKTNTSFESPDRLNMIVEGSKLTGDLTTESNLRIDGDVVGNITSGSKVVIGKSGVVKGDLICKEADIEGQIIGTLKIEGLLSLRSSAVVNGEISTSNFQVDEGAEFSGNCKMNNNTAASKTPQIKNQEDLVY